MLLLALAAVFAGLVSLQLHGYSLPLWHVVIEGGEMPEVLWGTPRPIRSDDWVVGLPMALAQCVHEPPFPRVDTLIGAGQDMLLFEMPIAHPVTLFRPASWGFFLGAGTGVAWMWWATALGMAAACFLALRVVSEGRWLPAALGALFFVFAPFMQFWSFLPARVTAYAALCMAAWAGLWTARRPAGALACGALLGWAGVCFVLVFYPPFQVPLAWVALALALGVLIDRARRGLLREHLGIRLAGLALAAGIAAVALVGFWLAAEPAIERMLGSAYPGGRRFVGGGLGAARLFGHALALGWQVESWEPWLNVSEGSGFWLLFPVSAVAVVAAARRRAADPLAVALLACIGLLSWHALVGLPAWLARITLLDQVQPSRTVSGIGLADVLLLVRVISTGGGRIEDARVAALIAGVWGALLLAMGLGLEATFPELGTAGLVAMAALNAGLAWAVLRGLPAALPLGVLVVASAATTLWFNPFVRGGVDYLHENPLSRRILAIDREAGGETRWLTYGSPYLANLFRTIGVHALNGQLSLPQPELWERVDPTDRWRRVWNRYAHVNAISTREPGVRFALSGPSNIDLIANPADPALAPLGVTHVLIMAPERPPAGSLPGLEYIGSHRWSHLYRVLPHEPRPAP